MIKVLENIGIEDTYLNIMKAVYERPTASIILNGETLEIIQLRSGIRDGHYPHSFSRLHSKYQMEQ